VTIAEGTRWPFVVCRSEKRNYRNATETWRHRAEKNQWKKSPTVDGRMGNDLRP
jgi:hypothetical protein